MRKLISPGHTTLAALFLGSALTLAACAPAPMDADTGSSGGSSGGNKSGGSSGSNSGGSSGSNSGGSSGSNSGGSGSSSGGSSGSNSGGSSGSSSGGSSGSSSGGSSGGTKSGGSTGSSSGGSSGSSGGSTGSSSGGSSGGMADAGGPPASGATFTMVYDTIIKPTCAGMACHGAAAGKGMLKYADKAMAYMTLKAKAGIITPGMPDKSKLISEITPKAGKAAMPAGGMPPLSADKIAMVAAWITAGANDD
jgi:hypothetical protein